MEPRTERERRREQRQAPNARDPLKFAAFGGYVKRLTTATLELVSETDEWKKRFPNDYKISPEVENKPFGDLLRENELDFDDIGWLMRPSTSSARCERRVLHVERFCAGAEFVLHNAVPVDPGNSELVEAEEPEAWVSDRNWVEETLVGPRPNYPLILDNKKLYQVLQKKVESFRNLFADYITPTPEPRFRLRESTWWRGCFAISFNIPYYGITTRKLEDCRTISNGGERLRNRHDLDFLHLEGYGISNGESSSFHDDAILHQLVFSLTVTGKSEKYWTAACLDDDVFGDDLGEEPRLALDADWDGMSDPILLQAERSLTLSLTLSPRAYAIAALEVALHKITEHHGNTSNAEGSSLPKISSKELQNWIEKFPEVLINVTHSTSNLVRKLDDFLEEDVVLGPDALPQGVLWQSLRHDSDALRSLLLIRQCRSDLRDIEGELKQLENAYEAVRRKRKNDNEGEQQNIAKQVHRIAIAAFVFAIPNTVAQLYSAMPDMGYSASWSSYVVMVMICVLLGTAVTMYLSGQSWKQVRRWFGLVVAFLPTTLRAWRHHA
ncbi:hypothetical protein CEP53_005546 [Fusarium sp. AF-6]|nr:hypothetical protein CEP53_005546 [Fusarium sp. AF-6]